MIYICLIGSIIAVIIAIQLGRIYNALYYIEKDLDDIAKHTSKEYKT